MLSRRPSLRVDPAAPGRAKPSSQPPTSFPLDNHEYPHSSVFRSSQLEIHVRSPSVKFVRDATEIARSLPVFGEHDKVTGVVMLDVGRCARPSRLTIQMEGTFVYMSPGVEGSEVYSADLPRSEKRRHVFFTSSLVHTLGELESPRSTSSLREAFAAGKVLSKSLLRRTPSQTDLSLASTETRSAMRPYQFSFNIPQSRTPGQVLPPTFESVSVGEGGARARASVERAEVSYAIVAIWESNDSSDRMLVEAPMIYQPEADFQSFDGKEAETWLERPLRSDRPLAIRCAVTLPDPAVFKSYGSIPYFVVFTTTPRSAALAREVASDATISVSLLREVCVEAPLRPRSHRSPSLYSSTPSTSSDESDFPKTPQSPHHRLLNRVVKSAPPSVMRRHIPQEKPLPEVPPPTVAETRALHWDVCVGFPKRPRYKMAPDQKHPSLETHTALPDGLYKGRIQLDKHMLPAFDWAGLSVKYYLDVSVLFGQDEVRARVPVRIA